MVDAAEGILRSDVLDVDLVLRVRLEYTGIEVGLAYLSLLAAGSESVGNVVVEALL